MAAERKTLLQLFIPISLETLCFMLTGMVDTVMLSSVGDKAVGAVGTANTYIGMFIVISKNTLFNFQNSYIPHKRLSFRFWSYQSFYLISVYYSIYKSSIFSVFSCFFKLSFCKNHDMIFVWNVV